MKILGIPSYPFTDSMLKSCFRESAKKVHPDMGGSSKAFIEVNDAYEHLQNLSIQGNDDTVTLDAETIPTKEGVWDTCPACKGERAIISTRDELADCPECKGSGKVTVKCRACTGSGRFITRSGFNVRCKSCDSTGTFNKPIACPKCNHEALRIQRHNVWFMFTVPPVGKIYIPMGIKVTCSTCFGQGKIRLDIFNAVIPEKAILR